MYNRDITNNNTKEKIMVVNVNEVVTVETLEGLFTVTVIEGSDIYGDFMGKVGSSVQLFNVEKIVK